VPLQVAAAVLEQHLGLGRDGQQGSCGTDLFSRPPNDRVAVLQSFGSQAAAGGVGEDVQYLAAAVALL